MRLYEVEVVRYIRETTTVYVATELGRYRVVDPPNLVQIIEKAQECDWEPDWEYVPCTTISRIEEKEDQCPEDVSFWKLVELKSRQ